MNKVRGPGQYSALRYGRHFGLLALTVVVLAFTVPWRPRGPVSSAGFYGSLHALMLVLSLRESATCVRQLAFVALAGCLTMFSLAFSLEFGRVAAAFPIAGMTSLMLALAAGVGASTYGLLIRRFWIDRLPLRALACMAGGCAVASTIAFKGVPSAPARGGLWLVAAWWFAFSAALLFYDGNYREDR